MSDKFLQLRNNYCYQYKKHRSNENATSRIHTDTPLKQANFNSPRKLIKTTQASFFDQFKKIPTPKPTAYQFYLQNILQNKTLIKAKQHQHQQSFTLHNICGQQIKTTTFRQYKQAQNMKTEHLQPIKLYNSPKKIIQRNSFLSKTEKLSTQIDKNIIQGLLNDNFDELEPWNTSELKKFN